MIARITSTALLALAAIAGMATAANADTFHHIDGIATRLEADTDTLVSEVVTHYRHSPYYPHIISDTVKMKRLASHIHEVVHHEGASFHLQRDVAQLDALFHHVERLIKQAEFQSRHSFYGGHVHGNTAHVCRGLKLIENDIHHLQEDLALLAPPVHAYHRPVYGAFGGHGSHGGSGHGGHGGGGHSGRSGGGITVGRGGIQFRFGF